MTDYLANACPKLARNLDKLALADLPTPVGVQTIDLDGKRHDIAIKYDNLTSTYYGGNKLRKLEYLLQRALDRRADRVATFGAAGSHHVLATTLYAAKLDLPCTCLLSHQAKTATIAGTLERLLANGAEIVRFGGNYRSRLETMRRRVQGRNAWVIPMGGSSWLGATGYVNAGLELAAQVDAGDIEAPRRIYIATGTMGSAAGLALGLALAGLDTEVQAVRVSPESIMSRERLARLANKTATMLHRLDDSIPADLARDTRITVRDDFYGDGYAISNPVTDTAVAAAKNQLGLTLEPTYTGKAMAALLYDLSRDASGPALFWNTYNSNRLPPVDAADVGALPADFRRYFD